MTTKDLGIIRSSIWSNGERLFHECIDLHDNNRGLSSTLCKMKFYTWDSGWRMDIYNEREEFVARFESIHTCPFCGIYLKDANEKELNEKTKYGG